jgi:hypothetical protein
VQRSIQQFPRQGAEGPWQISNDHWTNVKTFRHNPIASSSPMDTVAAEISA